jgi:hypothetical protein
MASHQRLVKEQTEGVVELLVCGCVLVVVVVVVVVVELLLLLLYDL